MKVSFLSAIIHEREITRSSNTKVCVAHYQVSERKCFQGLFMNGVLWNGVTRKGIITE